MINYLSEWRKWGWGWGASCPNKGTFTPMGQAAQAMVSYPHPFLFREEWLMVHFMTIQMTVQKESLFSDKLSFGMESARFSGIVASF